MRSALLALLLFLLLPLTARAEGTGELPAEIRDAGDWQLKGSARLRVYLFHVYDGALWAPDGEWGWEQPFVLDFKYARNLKGEDIAERGAKEMKELGHCDLLEDCWLDEQKQAFPDVSDGDRITGWYRPGESVRFYFNGEFRHEVDDPDFARPFFEIWLSEHTTAPAFRRRLLGK
ncbi:chalcone isomerase family protein [Gammaproteobacteria bacterium AB-CW1]|uniref:Chalcone isomerase family protein n=1 Tax=Natronospira elongata TaxID=3110268 RepID=A0AAP6JCV8_9GAMM|nr:chalcone isomerase family protein [Gammaproteobacteria bacterium AB-CW1]